MSASKPVRVVHAGLGPIGREVVRALLDADTIALVGVADIDQKIAGKPLSGLVDHPKTGGLSVAASTGKLLSEAKPDLLTQTTGSHLGRIFDSLTEIVDAGVSVVSTAEELLFPWHRHPDLAADLHRRASASGSRVLGTGINPGLLMDLLPVVLSHASVGVRGVRAVRMVDVATRRGPLQRKVGAGLSVEEFRSRVAAGRLGHVGLQESAALLAHKLGWKLAALNETIEPVVAKRPMKTDHVTVEPGMAAGVHQIVRGHTGDGRSVELDLTMCLGADDPHDAVKIDGKPPIDVRIVGGCAGDPATVACTLNAIPRLLSMPAGLWTVADLPPSAVANPPAV